MCGKRSSENLAESKTYVPGTFPLPLMKLRISVSFGLIGLLTLTAGCDAVATLRGEHNVVISGDVADAFVGEAVYSVLNGPSGPRFVLLLSRDDLRDNDEDDYTYIVMTRQSDVPGVGVFTIAENDASNDTFTGSFADLARADEPLDATGPVLSARTGVLSITNIEGDYLVGAFRFDARGLNLPDRSGFIDAALDGVFEARPVSPSTLENLEVDFDFQ